MIFKQWQQVLDGTKTQTRRLVKEGEKCFDGFSVAKTWTHVVLGTTAHRAWVPYYPKWQAGRTYAVQPGRGKKAVGRIHITKIRREYLQEIIVGDIFAEGVPPPPLTAGKDAAIMMARHAFRNLWDSIHKKAPHRFWDNPEVWVLTFERVEDG